MNSVLLHALDGFLGLLGCGYVTGQTTRQRKRANNTPNRLSSSSSRTSSSSKAAIRFLTLSYIVTGSTGGSFRLLFLVVWVPLTGVGAGCDVAGGRTNGCAVDGGTGGAEAGTGGVGPGGGDLAGLVDAVVD